MKHTSIRLAVGFVGAAIALAAGAGPAVAHAPHETSAAHQGDGQVLANGQNHGLYAAGKVCSGAPASYGLETAHHGPDAGTPGKGDDGCYQVNGTVPGNDVTSPVIR